MIKYVYKFIKVLNSNIEPSQVALGMTFGFVLGIIPVSTLHWWAILILMYITKSNLAVGFAFIFFFKILGLVVAPFFDWFGYLILTRDFLNVFFTKLFNMPVIPFTRFFNTVVMGATVAGIVLFLPAFLVSRKFVILYRTKIRDRFENSKFYKFIMKIPVLNKIIKLLTKAKQIGEAV